ncbi:MAG: PIN domain-containing protein [Acidobacteria bacterium]|nr:PIN domain-containing protein [Acidobacteriota bacterium]MBI3421719.1 PIN domain-containing protein [Acidobacteriota bacterium]
MALLLDTGFAVALFHEDDQRHADVLGVVQQIRDQIIFPIPAITETVYLLRRDAGNEVATHFIASLATTALRLENPLPPDYQRAAALMRQYADAKLDFVDALIVALAERLNITRLLTLDQRDFRLVRPRHCAAFELLP